MLLLHILTALTSVGFTTYLYFSPSTTKLRVSYGLLAGTVGTGTYLVISTHAPMLQSCITGLVYIGVVSVGILAARSKLARVEARTDSTFRSKQ